MAVKKVSDTTVRKIHVDVVGEQPVERHSGPPFDPQHVEITVKDGRVSLPYLTGPAYTASGKLGKRMVGGSVGKDHAAPWLIKLMADEGLEWPR